MAPIAQMAEDMGVAVLLIRHLNKAAYGKALYRGGGAIAIAGAARSVLLVANSPDDDGTYVLAPVKHNLTAPPSSLAFHVGTTETGIAHIVWDGVSTHGANALCAQSGDIDERNANRELADYLKEMLQDAPRTLKDIKRLLREAGFDIPGRTLRRARDTIGATWRRDGFGGGVIWTLPLVHNGQIPVSHGHSGHSGEGEGLNAYPATTYQNGQHPQEVATVVATMESFDPEAVEKIDSRDVDDTDYERIEREAIQHEDG